MLPRSDQPNTYDQKLEIDENNESVQMWLHKDIRAREDPDCDFAGYYIAGGREYCGIYIGVECGEDDQMCAFKIELELLEWTEDFTVFQNEEQTQTRVPVEPLPPRYIPKDQDYVDGKVEYGQDMRFYYPVVPEESGDVLILVNKTGPIHENGDLSLGMNIQANANKPYKEWNLPTGRRNTARSRTFDPVQPEIINMSKEKLENACNDVLSNCAVLINVRGESQARDSHFRVKVFNGTNRLYPNEPIDDAILVAGEYKYYWFVSTAAMAATLEIPNWLHEIGLGIKTPGQDVDMYLSVMDGRFPTEEDYDYKSVNLGSDWITISNNDTVLRNDNSHSWNPRVGMVVVIGVRARFSGASAYSLVLKGPDKTFYDMTTLSTNDYEQVDVEADLFYPLRGEKRPVVKVFVYKWFNWQHVDFKLNVKITTGSADFFLNSIGENNYEENAVSGVPLGAANSQWSTSLNRTAGFWQDSVTVLKIDTQSIPQFCYNCWYYLTVKIVDPEETTYRVFFQEVPDSGYNYLVLENGSSTEFLKLRSRSKERESMASSYLTRRTPSRLSSTTLSATPSSMSAEIQTQSILTPFGPSSLEWATEQLMLEEMTLDSSSQPGTTSVSSLSEDLPSPTLKSPKTGKSTCSQMDTAFLPEVPVPHRARVSQVYGVPGSFVLELQLQDQN